MEVICNSYPFYSRTKSLGKLAKQLRDASVQITQHLRIDMKQWQSKVLQSKIKTKMLLQRKIIINQTQLQINFLADYSQQIEGSYNRLNLYKKEIQTIQGVKTSKRKRQENSGGFFGLFSQEEEESQGPMDNSVKNKMMIQLKQRYQDLNKLKSVYLWGDPGSGKSFLMDLFYENIDIKQKRKMHYNEFMLEIHKEEHKVNKTLRHASQDTISVVGNEFCRDLQVFCIDEFQVLDIADAMILKRLFEQFWENKVLVFFTSNRPPEDLYLNGLQRYLFMPFIDQIKEECHVVSLNSLDYRLLNSIGLDSYYYPINEDSNMKIQRIWERLTNNSEGTPKVVQVAQGRTLNIQKQWKNVAQITFQEMCESAKGGPDYMALGQNYNTIILRGVPRLSMERRDSLRRFIWLIDELYYQQRKVIIEAETDLDSLFKKPSEKSQLDEEFAFDRCLSRLKEMQTNEYQEKALAKKEHI